ncbi:MAG: hypothetical protein E5X77_44035 [Mesorhizobium sp.]|nr:MAG: hypothetical protein E5X77_44035 [Mesorhizobium sp.]
MLGPLWICLRRLPFSNSLRLRWFQRPFCTMVPDPVSRSALGRVRIQVRPSREWWLPRTGAERTQST